MTDDPDDPDYRYPQPGERLWHWRENRWCITRAYDPSRDSYNPEVVGEVNVVFEGTGERATVKLYNLDEATS